MKIAVQKAFLKIFFSEKTSMRFGVGVTLGLAFSISVILSTIGLMDGFTFGLKSALKRSQGDLSVYSRQGYFEYGENLKSELEILGVPKEQTSAVVQSEGFLLHQQSSRGVQVMGISPETYSAVVGMNFSPLEDERAKGVLLGKKLAEDFAIQVGDEILLTLAEGGSGMKGLPVLKRFPVLGFVTHGIHEKDERTLYMRREKLQELLGIDDKVNIVTFNLAHPNTELEVSPILYTEQVQEGLYEVGKRLEWKYQVKPFWNDFTSLLEAVEVEKNMISTVLQLIVLISVFNVAALVIYFSEKKSQEIFLFQALGMSRRQLTQTWLSLAFLIWGLASGLSLVFVRIFDWGLGYLSMFQLPGDVYHLSRLGVRLTYEDYILVFTVTLIWILSVMWFNFFRKRKKSILSGLRQEFT